MENSELLTPAEVAQAYNAQADRPIVAETAREWMAEGVIPGAQALGATYIIEKAALKEALADGLERRADAGAENGREWIESYAAQEMLAEAGIVRVHVTVLEWLRRGVLPGQKAGKAWAVHKPTLARMLARGFQPPQRGRPRNAEV